MDMPTFLPGVLKWCFPTLPHMSPHPWPRCEKVLVYVPVDNTHPLLDIGAALPYHAQAPHKLFPSSLEVEP